MKVNKTKLWSVIGLSIGVLSAAQALPTTDAQTSVKAALVGVSGLELPSKTAGLIAAAPDQDKSATTISAVQVAVNMNPSAASAIVSAIATKVPTMAAVAAATAVELQPKQASVIAEAATKAAPGQAAAIVAECSKKLPAQYAAIAVAASKAAPEARQDILIAASKASPAPVRAHLVAAAASPAMVPVDVSLARAYSAQAPISQANRFGDYYAPGPSGGVDLSLGGHALIILQPSYEWVGPRHHSGSPVIGY